KILSLVSILPFAILIMGLRHLYWGLDIVSRDTDVFVSFFLGITIGPIAFTLFELLSRKTREKMNVSGYKEIKMKKSDKTKGIPNPFKILTKKEVGTSALGSLFGSITFFLTPVGMTVFWGELMTRH